LIFSLRPCAPIPLERAGVLETTMSKRKDKVASRIFIDKPNAMTLRGRRAIAKWMRHQADCFEKYGDKYASRFNARYIYA